jgi:hypothetical protein
MWCEEANKANQSRLDVPRGGGNGLQHWSEAPRPKGLDFPVRYFPFVLFPLIPPLRAGSRGTCWPKPTL